MIQQSGDISLLHALLQSEATARQVDDEIYSVRPPGETGGRYDRRVAAYDRVVGSHLYNRLFWGLSPDRYETFVSMALAAGTGPVLDAGAGSAVFTAEAYVRSSRPLLLVDRSQGMLRAAQERLTQAAGGAFPLHVTLLQGTIETLPLQSGSVDTVVSMGVLHLFEDVEHWLNPLLRMGSEGGMLFATSLVAERVVGRLYLRLLHATGEVATPRSYDGLRRKLSVVLDADVDVTREGSMAFVSARMG